MSPRTVTSHRAAAIAGCFAAALVLAGPAAHAATCTKANNTDALNLASSWDSLPGAADIAQWTALVTAASTPVLAADLSWAGIKLIGPAGPVTLGPGNTLTIGTSGIDLSTATQSLTLNCGLTLLGKQSWKAAANRTLTVAGSFTHSGAVVDFTNFTATATLGALANDSSGILGPWATTSSGTTLNYVKSTAGVIAAFSGQTPGTAGNLSNVTNAAANFSCAAAATQTGNLTANTLRYTGAAATLANGGFSSTLNGLMHAGSGTLTLSGTGNLVIGASKELVINSNTQSVTLAAALVNNAAGASALTYNGGSATSALTLSGSNTYSGGTTVDVGTLVLDVNRLNLGSGPLTLVSGTTFYTTNFEGTSAAGAIPNTFNLGTGFVNLKLNKDIWLAGPVAGPGGLAISGTGRSPGVMLSGAKTFGGGVKLTPANGIAPTVAIDHINSLGSGPLRTELTTTDVTAGNLEVWAPLTAAPGVANALDLAAGCRLVVKADGANSLWLSGPVSGTGSLVKIGSATLNLSGANTATGATRIVAGTLACASAFSLGGGTLDISSGAKLEMDFTGTRRVAALSFNAGAAQPNGTYGSSASAATYPNDSYFSGPGTLTVGPALAATTTTLALTGGSSPNRTGTPLTFTATVAGSAPTGSVSFYDGATPLATGVALNGAQQASLTTSSLAAGTHAITTRFEGNSANDPSVSAALTIQVAQPAELASFSFPGLPPTTFSGTNITVTVPYATDVTVLAPVYTLYAGATASPPSGSIGNFATPQTYTVTGADNSTRTYTVVVSKIAASTAKDITACTFPGLSAPTIGANTITLTVPYGTPVSALAPTYAVSPLAVPDAAYPSGSTRNFTSPQTYTITAENGSIKTYTVTVTVTPASALKDILTCSFGALGSATIAGQAITLTAPVNQDLTALAPTFTISPFATLSPASGSTQDFTNAVTYTVTAQNLTTKTYTVTVQAYKSWTYAASMFILTTPDGANIAAGASETNFPLLVRLTSGNFTFSQAQADGRDIRFATAAGAPLSYQIEQWDAPNGTACVWVKIPIITGNARQEIKMYWGKSGVASDSNPSAVFNSANGFASVIHMNETVSDAVGAVTPSDTGTTLVSGIIGKARNFTAGVGVNCGTAIASFPSGSNPHSTEAWIRPGEANTTVVGWGIEQGQGKVVMQLASPPHINMDCYFSGGNVAGAGTLALSQWIHVAHTYKNGEARVYVNGVQDGITSGGTALAIPSPVRMYLGGWYDNYTFVGDMDEVRISNVTRSANWIKMEYENQKPLQTLVGSLVQAGATFSATPAAVTLNEGTSTTLTAQAGGAQKVYWSLVQGGVETVLATDQFTFNVSAGRTTGNQAFVIRFKGIYPTGNQTVDIPVTVTDTIPDPVFTLSASTGLWDGRQTMTVTPNITNLAALQAAGAANLTYTWSVAGVAVAKQITAGTPTLPGSLSLTRAQGSGAMTVTLVLDNGGTQVSQSQTITVQEPASDAWVQRTPGATEKPVSGQFFARDPTGYGTIYYIGTQSGAPASVFLKIYTTDTGLDVPYSTQRQALVGTSYAFSAPIAAGKVTYKVAYGTTTSGGVDTVVSTVTNLVCGDAYIIQGQSNAVATDSLPADTTNSPWIRTYGQTTAAWGNAVRNGSDFWVGYWGFDLAVTLAATYNMPICILNGAVGGTRIDQHQANPTNHFDTSATYQIYGTLLNRVAGAKLTHGIRGIFWHQGENNSGAAAPTGDWDYKSYQQYFVDLSAAWKQDYPNIQRYIIFQVWPNPCSMGGKESSDMLREVQRTLPRMYSHMSLLSTLGLPGYLGCHYSAAGYQAIADETAPLVARDHYGATPVAAVTAPTLLRAYFTSPGKNQIALEFDQNMAWNSASTANFYLDRVGGKVTAGSATGKVVKLTLNASSSNQTLDYVVDQYWGGSSGDLLTGTNALYALTFYAVPIEPPLAQIAVEQPVGTSLVDAAASVDFGTRLVGQPTAITFTIRNSGTDNLTGIAAAIDGTAMGEYVVTSSPAATVAPAATTTCTVTFTPALSGARAAGLHIASSDSQRNPFDVALTGQGNHAPVFAGFALSGPSGQALTIYPGKLLARASDPDGDALSLTRVFGPSAQGGTVTLAGAITYTPPSGWVGPDSFDVELTDARGASARGSVTVTLTAVPDGTAALGQNLTTMTLHDGKADMVFRGIPGRAYLIQRSSDLTNWSDLATITAGADGKIPFSDPAPPLPQGFYRTRAP